MGAARSFFEQAPCMAGSVNGLIKRMTDKSCFFRDFIRSVFGLAEEMTDKTGDFRDLVRRFAPLRNEKYG